MVDNWLNFAHLRRGWRRALDFAVQPSCLLCGGLGLASMDLCRLCADMLPRPPPVGAAAEPAPVPGCILRVAALEYAWPVDLLVQELKFAGNWPVARVFGSLLAEARRALPLPLPQVLIPVPLHPQRLAERGFNQAEHLARHTADALGLVLAPPLLRRRRPTAVQSQLGAAARRENLRDAFELNELSGDARYGCCGHEHQRASSSGPALGPAMPWQHVALLDDVVTTGSTLAAATSALRRAGVRHIEWWTAAAATLAL